MKAMKSFLENERMMPEWNKKEAESRNLGKVCEIFAIRLRGTLWFKKLENTDKTHLAKRAPVNTTRALEMKASFLIQSRLASAYSTPSTPNSAGSSSFSISIYTWKLSLSQSASRECVLCFLIFLIHPPPPPAFSRLTKRFICFIVHSHHPSSRLSGESGKNGWLVWSVGMENWNFV